MKIMLQSVGVITLLLIIPAITFVIGYHQGHHNNKQHYFDMGKEFAYEECQKEILGYDPEDIED